MKTQRLWREPCDVDDIAELSRALAVSRLEAEFLWRREIRSNEAFLALSEAAELASPYELSDMDKAVTIIRQVLKSGERLRIYGDYDADGVTATALLYRGLRALGFREQLDFYIPNRFDEGYGLNVEAVWRAHHEGIALMVTVDCGSSSPEAADLARTLGMGIVITDHHALGAVWPNAEALVNPECRQSEDRLSGAGVALQLVRALLNDEVPEMLYGIAAIGTIADVVPLKYSNRSLVRRGLKALRGGAVPGLTQLFLDQGRPVEQAGVGDVGFMVGPRLNAAGRMGDAGLATTLLTSDHPREIATAAGRLTALNAERRTIEQQLVTEAWSLLPRDRDGHLYPFTVIAGDGWHEGVVGIVASRFREWLARPVAVVTYDGDHGKGSARSVEGFNLIAHLRQSRERFTKLGGHPGAAGFSLHRQDAGELSALLSQNLPPSVLRQQYRGLQYDVKVGGADEARAIWAMVEKYGPFGHHFEMPRVLVQGTVGQARTMGQNQQHLSLTLKEDTTRAVGFGLGRWASGLMPGAPVQLLATLEENWYRGTVTPQWRIQRVDGPHPRRAMPLESLESAPAPTVGTIWVASSDRALREWAPKLGAVPYLSRLPLGELTAVEELFRRGLIDAIMVNEWREWPNLFESAHAVVWLSPPSSSRRQEEAAALLSEDGRAYLWDVVASRDSNKKAGRLAVNRAALTRHWRQWQDGRVGLTVGRAIFNELGLSPGEATEKRPLDTSFLYRLALWQAQRDE